jgi:prepilin-type N-terminal cleavage/methylation domain-containing protein
MPGRTEARGFTLLETLAVLVVVSIAAGLVLARLPHATTLRLHGAGARLAERLSEARERAILGGSAVRVDLTDRLPEGVRLASLDLGGTPGGATLELEPEGDALPARAVLSDASASVVVVLPPGFQRARVEATP